MNIDPDAVVALTGGGGIVAMLGTMIASLVRTNNGLHAQVREERESCAERIGKLETRLDKEREDADDRHQRTLDRLEVMERKIRRITPTDFPKVTP